MEFGLIGYPLGHSFSPAYFQEKFGREGIDASYEAFPLPQIGALPELLHARPGLRGLNVTIPYKEAVLPLLDALHPDAAAIGAVNCIAIRNGQLTGYNTDWIGFAESLAAWLGPLPRRALVLGTGGASKAVLFALQRLGIEAATVSRTRKKADYGYGELSPDRLRAHPLVVNTTPLGTAPDVDAAPPLPYAALTPEHALYDLVYNPPETRFLREGAQRGAAVKNGYEMLVRQAEAGWTIWSAP